MPVNTPTAARLDTIKFVPLRGAAIIGPGRRCKFSIKACGRSAQAGLPWYPHLNLLWRWLKSVYSFSVFEYHARHSVTTLNITMSPNDRWPTMDTLSAVRNGDLPISIKNLARRQPSNGDSKSVWVGLDFSPKSTRRCGGSSPHQDMLCTHNAIAKLTRLRSVPALERVLDLKFLQVRRLESLLLDLFQVRVPVTFGNQERAGG